MLSTRLMAIFPHGKVYSLRPLHQILLVQSVADLRVGMGNNHYDGRAGQGDHIEAFHVHVSDLKLFTVKPTLIMKPFFLQQMIMMLKSKYVFGKVYQSGNQANHVCIIAMCSLSISILSNLSPQYPQGSVISGISSVSIVAPPSVSVTTFDV